MRPSYQRPAYPRTAFFSLLIIVVVWPLVEMLLLSAALLPVNYAHWYSATNERWLMGQAIPSFSEFDTLWVLNTGFYCAIVPLGLVFAALPVALALRRGYVSRANVAVAALITLTAMILAAPWFGEVAKVGGALSPGSASSAAQLGLSFLVSGLACRWLLMRLGMRRPRGMRASGPPGGYL